VALGAGEGGDGLGGVALVFGEVSLEVVGDADGEADGDGVEEESARLAAGGAAPPPAPDSRRQSA